MKMGVLYDQLVRVISIMEFSSVILYSRMFILLLVILLVTELTSATSSPRVIIVGAGMSGITAAKTLSENGIKDFLILEATDRIGGRMHKTNFQGLTIEMGANWVEGVGGPKINPIWELANKVKLRNFYSDLNNVSFNFYDQYGHLLPDSVASAVFDQFDAASDHAATLSRSLNANEEDDVSILTSQRLFGDIPSTPVQMAIDYYNYDYEFAEPPRVTSLQSTVPLPTFRNFGEDTHFVADSRGYEYIVHYLAQQFLKSEKETIVDDRLQLNKVVREINHTAKGVTVRTEDGGVYNAKYAMVSVSLGVLQSNLIKFQPDLPHWKLLPLFEFDMAIYTKIFMKFPHKFWPTGNGTEFFIYADEKRGYYPIWQQMEMEYPGSNILMVTVTDDESRRIEQQSDHQTQAEIMTVLRKIFGKQIPEPEAILVPRWWSDRLYRGTFSNWPIGVTRHEFDELRAPVGSVYFTGEHTSEFYNGYVHGAYFSGIDSANMLVDCIKKGKCHQRPHDVMDKKNKRKRGQCKGACCSQIQREREVMRQTWMKKINALEKIIEVTNHTKP